MIFESRPGENPPKFLFLEPNPLINGIIAQLSLKKYFFPEFWAYLTLRIQILYCAVKIKAPMPILPENGDQARST